MSVDDPLVMDANYRFGPTDRRKIDDQIRAVQGRVDEIVENGVAGAVEVVDDIAQSGGVGTAIDRVQGIKGVTLEPTDTLATGEVWLKRGGGSTLRAGKPVPPAWFDPADYGAVLDGVTDDLSAFQAMHAAMPVTGGRVHMHGLAWLSDEWRISKPIHMHGHGSTPGRVCGFEVPAGRRALTLDRSTVSLDGNDAQQCNISRLNFISRNLVHPNADGSALGLGIREFSSTGEVRVGDVFVEAAAANPTRCYRATSMTANSGKGPGAFGASAPAWTTTPGATVVDNGITWTTEAIPYTRTNLTVVAVGERVWADMDNRYTFVCTVGGTTDASPPAEMLGGDNIAGLVANDTFVDGSVTWRADFATAIYVRAVLVTIREVDVLGFTNAGIHVQGGVGLDVLGDTNSDNFGIDHVVVNYCGLGVYVAGDDANGWEINRLWGLSLGTFIPTPATVIANGYTDGGGHILCDHSLGSGLVSNLYAQLSTGRAILKTGLGRMTCVSCFTEVDLPSHFSAGGATLIGGDLDTTISGSVLLFDPLGGTGRGLEERDNRAATPLTVRLTSQDTYTVLPLKPLDVNPDNIGWRYGYSGMPAGWWEYSNGFQMHHRAFAVSGGQTGTSPGAGWFTLPDGHFLGDPALDTLLHRGNARSLISKDTRGGSRIAGDEFASATSAITVASSGYRGRPWIVALAAAAVYEPWSISATVVEPTTNTGLAAGGEKVFECTVGATTAGSEPNWATATIVGDTVSSGDGVTWRLVGFTPPVEVVQRTAKARKHTRAFSAQTTTAAASQVIETGGVVDGVDLALPDNAITRVTDVVHLHKPSTANGGTVEIRSDWVRDAAGAPTQIGASVITYNLTGTTLDGSTVAHAANGNRIELQVSPETAEALNWRGQRTQSEGVD